MDQYVYAKVISAVLVVLPIVILIKVSGQRMASLYLSKGNLKLGLTIGISLFVFFLVTSVPAAMLLYGGKGLTYSSLFNWAPWIFTFILANGIREELLFRGLFLKKYQFFLGLPLSNFLQAAIFVLPHFGESYSPVMAIFLVITFLLGLAFGAIIQRTNSLLGSILFHAGADIPVILGIFSNF
jgi:membrane protease YdiL (CAAX protease family)